ncbi:MAG TPA: M20 family metallopeptidase [Williamwhitmania sp.]|nr:M20 family metallopeptidase [Williamwhitmania sp.]
MISVDELLKEARQLLPNMTKTRREIHQHPELSFQEFSTSALIMERLEGLGIEHHSIAGTGVYAIVRCGKPNAEVIALRADMDALPVTEATGLPFASTVAGVMHACGHDLHTSCLLGAAELLIGHKKQLNYDVLLLFQPGEEMIPGGAKKIIEEGLFDKFKPKAMFALHVDPDLPVGKFGFRPSWYMASGDEIYLKVTGRGGHAALPHTVTDTVLATAEIIVSLQQVVSRRAPAGIPTVLSFGKVVANGATNVIPDEVLVEGTFRTFDETWRTNAHQVITDVAVNIAKAHGAQCKVEVKHGYPALYNNPELTQYSIDMLARLWRSENINALDIRMTTEDFARYSHLFPSVFFRLGVAGQKSVGRLHAGNFSPDEEALFYGSASLIWLVLSLE